MGTTDQRDLNGIKGEHMSRHRHAIRALVALSTLALVAAACGGDDDATTTTAPPATDATPDTGGGELGGSLVISNWDEYTPEGLLPGFEAATGVSVTLTNHATNEEIVAKLIQSRGQGYDVAFVSGQFAQQLNEAGLLAPIDASLIPNLANLAPEARQLATDPGLAFSVPYTWGTTGLCYRTDLVSETPDSWMDLLRPSDELRGKITMLATDRWLLLPAQKALGFSVNTTDPDELAQVKDLLLEAKGGLLAFDDTTFYSRLVSGEAFLVQAWDGWCNYAIAENENVKFVVPSEGSDLWTDVMVILDASANKEAAHAFINWVLQPENHVTVAELVLYKVPNPAAMDLLDPELIQQFPNLGMSPEELLQGEQLTDLGDAQPLYTELVTEVLAG
jgi:spermidine/putrescine transport system substrate-binding protein